MYNRITSLEAVKNKIGMAQYAERSIDDTWQERFDLLKADPRFAGWSDVQISNYLNASIANNNVSRLNTDLQAGLSNFGKPTDAFWSQFTYEEILAMEDNGEIVPEEFLEWAHAMEGADTSEYQLEDMTASDINEVDTLTQEFADPDEAKERNAARMLAKKAIIQDEVLVNAQKEFERYSSQLDISTNEAENIQEQTLQKVQSMMSEWQVLDKKAKSGAGLSPEEQARYNQYGIMMNNESLKANVQISTFTTDFDEISALLKTVSTEAKVAQDLSLQANHLGKLIAPDEGKHSYMSVHGNTGFNGSFGVMELLKSASVGRNLSINTIKEGADLQFTVSSSDKMSKKVSNQMKNMMEVVEIGNSSMSKEVQDVKNEAEPVENYEKVGDVPEVEPPKPEEGMDAPPQPKKNKEDEENVFTDEEDLNDIDSILKRQQKKAPEPEVDNMIIN